MTDEGVRSVRCDGTDVELWEDGMMHGCYAVTTVDKRSRLFWGCVNAWLRHGNTRALRILEAHVNKPLNPATTPCCCDEAHDFENCKGCEPAMVDAKTGEKLPDDHPKMVVALEVWRTQSLETKRAWHRTTVHNSLDDRDKALAQDFVARLVAAWNDAE